MLRKTTGGVVSYEVNPETVEVKSATDTIASHAWRGDVWQASLPHIGGMTYRVEYKGIVDHLSHLTGCSALRKMCIRDRSC